MDLSRAQWRKSHRSSDTGQCVEVAFNLRGVVAVRDSKNTDGPVLILPRAEWQRFLTNVRNGVFQ